VTRILCSVALWSMKGREIRNNRKLEIREGDGRSERGIL
jgi:hypothetical protein